MRFLKVSPLASNGSKILLMRPPGGDVPEPALPEARVSELIHVNY